MRAQRFTWDQSKRLSNIRKHGLDFADAKRIFNGVYTSHVDDRYLYSETRCVALGLLDGRPVSITYTEEQHEIRTISFRKATRKEQKDFTEIIAYRLGKNR